MRERERCEHPFPLCRDAEGRWTGVRSKSRVRRRQGKHIKDATSPPPRKGNISWEWGGAIRSITRGNSNRFGGGRWRKSPPPLCPGINLACVNSVSTRGISFRFPGRGREGRSSPLHLETKHYDLVVFARGIREWDSLRQKRRLDICIYLEQVLVNLI